MSSSLINEPKPLPHVMDDPELLRQFANVRLIAFDLDGTLITSRSPELGPRLVDLCSTVGRKDVIVTLATGRSLTGVRGVLGQLENLKRVPLVLYNGSVVIRPDHQALIAHSAMSRVAVEEVLSIGATLEEGSAFLYSLDSDAALVGGGATTEAVFLTGPKGAAAAEFNGMPVQALELMDLEIAKIVAVLFEVPSQNVQVLLATALAKIQGVSVTRSGGKYIEVRPAGSSKATGLQRLVEHLGIQSSEVLAMGDNDNDVELLEWAGISVCVDQSSPAARQASKYFSSHGAGEAAIDILEVVRRAKRLFRGGKVREESST